MQVEIADDVWVNIFQFVVVHDLLSIRRTCHHLKQLTLPQQPGMNQYWKLQTKLIFFPVFKPTIEKNPSFRATLSSNFDTFRCNQWHILYQQLKNCIKNKAPNVKDGLKSDNPQCNLLINICICHYLLAFKLLLFCAYNGNVNVQIFGNNSKLYNFTPLFASIMFDSNNIFKYLLNNPKIDLSVVSGSRNLTPLMLAICKQHAHTYNHNYNQIRIKHSNSGINVKMTKNSTKFKGFMSAANKKDFEQKHVGVEEDKQLSTSQLQVEQQTSSKMVSKNDKINIGYNDHDNGNGISVDTIDSNNQDIQSIPIGDESKTNVQEKILNVDSICDHKFNSSNSMCEMLLNHRNMTKAIVNATDNAAFTAVHWAISKNCFQNISLLIKHGASVNKATLSGRTPLHFAIALRKIECVKQLLKNTSINVNMRDINGNSPLSYCAIFYQESISLQCLKLFSQYNKLTKTSLSAVDNDGMNLFMIAAMQGRFDIVRFLYKHLNLMKNKCDHGDSDDGDGDGDGDGNVNEQDIYNIMNQENAVGDTIYIKLCKEISFLPVDNIEMIKILVFECNVDVTIKDRSNKCGSEYIKNNDKFKRQLKSQEFQKRFKLRK